MSKIVDIGIGQILPPERWIEASENMIEVFNLVENYLRKANKGGMGKQAAMEFHDDASLAIVAMRYVAQFATDKCRFMVLPDYKDPNKR